MILMLLVRAVMVMVMVTVMRWMDGWMPLCSTELRYITFT